MHGANMKIFGIEPKSAKGKGKGKVHPGTSHEGAGGERGVALLFP